MWISKKKFKALEKRIADLENKIQSQPEKVFVPEDSNGKHTTNQLSRKDIS